MFDFKNTEDLIDFKELSKQNILNKLTQEQIYTFYFQKEINLNDQYSNPLRDDKLPGCKFYLNKKNTLLFKDFSRNAPPIDCFNFIMLKYNITFVEALEKINFDFNLKLGLNKPVNLNPVKIEKTKKLVQNKEELIIKIRNYTNSDMKYWNAYGIKLSTLNKFNVYAVQKVWKGEKLLFVNLPSNPIYCYKFYNNSKKIYRPRSKNFRFLSSGKIKNVYQGYEFLPESSDLLIITKSLKDVMCLYELGYCSIAPNGEGYDISEKVMSNLKPRFKKIIMFYDNDEAGLLNSGLIADKYDLDCIFLNKHKDISDNIKNEGFINSKKTIKKLIKEIL